MSATETTTIATGSWAVDPIHTTIGFAVKHLGVSTFRGSFTDASGTIATEDGTVTEVSGEFAVASVTTRDPHLDGHLQGPDFFDADNHPKGSFRSTSIRQDGDRITIDGELTLRGVTRPVSLRGEIALGSDPYGNDRLGLAVKGQIDRSEFGITWNAPLANGAFAVAERVTLELDVETVKV